MIRVKWRTCRTFAGRVGTGRSPAMMKTGCMVSDGVFEGGVTTESGMSVSGSVA